MNDDGGEVTVELVAKDRQVTLYLEDHGDPIPSAKIKGTLRVQRVSVDWAVALKPARENQVLAQLPQALRDGDGVWVDVSFPNGSIAQAKFVYREDVQSRNQRLVGKK